MNIRINGDGVKLDGVVSIAEFVAERRINPLAVVVEHNGAILRQKDWQGVVLKDGDNLEIVSFVGGG
jgi:sulfur carrier protein